MEKESFEDGETARLLNEAFISIKVDREERPDIDAHYMAVCQMLTGSGGWPLSIFMTPDRQPFFAGTYFPKERRFGLSGFKDLITRIAEAWKTRPRDLLGSAERIAAALRETAEAPPAESPGRKTMDDAFDQLSNEFDPVHGGFGGAPKFPLAHRLFFLLRYADRTGNRRAVEMVEKTLLAMRRGGLFDQLGFGFHRYSTDPGWRIPHFEKMLYDQALLTMAYTEAYQVTGREEFRGTVEETTSYVLRELVSPEGGSSPRRMPTARARRAGSIFGTPPRSGRASRRGKPNWPSGSSAFGRKRAAARRLGPTRVKAFCASRRRSRLWPRRGGFLKASYQEASPPCAPVSWRSASVAPSPLKTPRS